MGDLQNLSGGEAIAKIKHMLAHTKVCMFCTDLEEIPFSTRPMAAQDVDEQGNVWFLSGKDSHKNQEIADDRQVQLIFANPDRNEFLSISGIASILTDRKLIEEKWSPIAKSWFTEGKNDSSISCIRVQPLLGYYWDTKHGKVVSLIKIVAGAVSGVTMDDGLEGELSV